MNDKILNNTEAVEMDNLARIYREDYIPNVLHQRAEKERFIGERVNEWEEEGQRYKKEREELGITKHEMACAISVSTTTISNFEKGYPVQRAELLKSAYDLYLQNVRLKKQVEQTDSKADSKNPIKKCIDLMSAMDLYSVGQFYIKDGILINHDEDITVELCKVDNITEIVFEKDSVLISFLDESGSVEAYIINKYGIEM